MAIWVYAYGKNGILKQNQNVLDVLNKLDLDEVKILDSILEIRQGEDSIEKHYQENRTSIEEGLNAQTDEEYDAYLSTINFPKVDRHKLVDYFISERNSEREEREGAI